MIKWEEALLRYGQIAYATGQKLEFSVKKRVNQRAWSIELKKVYEHGEDNFYEED